MTRLLALFLFLAATIHAEPRLKVITYNIHYGAGPKHRAAAQGLTFIDGIADLLRAQNPDVVALQEVASGWWLADGHSQRRRLAEKTGWTILYKVANTHYGNNAGIAIMTRHRVLEQRLVEVMAAGTYVIPDRIGETERAERRLAQAALIDVPGWGPIWFVNTHFHARSGSLRRGNFERLQNDLVAKLSGPVVILGDFNSRAADPRTGAGGEMVYGRSLLRTADGGRFTDVLEARGVRNPRTFIDTDQHFRLDWIFFRPDLMRVDHAYVTGWEQSDHEAIVAVLRPRAPPPAPIAGAGLLGIRSSTTASSGTR